MGKGADWESGKGIVKDDWWLSDVVLSMNKKIGRDGAKGRLLVMNGVMNGVTYITDGRGGCAQGSGIYNKMLLTREVGLVGGSSGLLSRYGFCDGFSLYLRFVSGRDRRGRRVGGM